MNENPNYLKNISIAVSVILHPISLPSLLFLIIYTYVPGLLSPWTEEGKLLVLGMIFFSTYLLPVLISFFYFYSSHKNFSFASLFMSDKKERFRPFLMVSCVYAFLAYVLNIELKANYVVVGIIAIMSCTIFFSALISTFWKISIHALAMSGFTAFLLILNERFAEGELYFHILISILLSGVLLSSRLYLNEHTPLQVLAGWLLGMTFTLSGMLYFLF